ncbi:MAG TPA: Ig-like domain-containing protein, partial [Acidimicrobiia bacterium]|nr:Ig-like domain-containing protein [Acidimicrobiia bacterium]
MSTAEGAPSRPGRRRWVYGGIAGILVIVLAAVALTRLLDDDEGEPVAVPAGPDCETAFEIGPRRLEGPPESWGKLTLRPERRCFTLTATKKDGPGVAPDTEFVLAASEALTPEAARERLSVDPPVDLAVTAEGNDRLRLKPAAPLTGDTVYRVSLLDRPGGRPVDRWSFEARGPLRVVATLPADQSTQVPLDVGIELTFSHDGVSGVEERLEIEPDVDGRFEVHRRTAVFVPKDLRPGTLYTVTLAPGASVPGSPGALEAAVTFRFETGDTKRGEPPASDLRFSRDVWESATAEAPVLGAFGLPGGQAPGLTVEVHRFDGQDEFLGSLDALAAIPTWASFSRERFSAPTDGLDVAARFDAPLERAGPSGELFVRFPEPLPAGYYLVAARVGEDRAQAWLQVSDLAAYASVSDTRTLVWVNDLKAGGPAGGAKVSVVGGGDAVGTAGADGVALFDTPPALVELAP